MTFSRIPAGTIKSTVYGSFFFMSILCCINGTSFANNVLDNQKVTNRDIANLVLDQFDALKKSVKSYSSYQREPKHIIIVYAGNLDIDKITDEFRPSFRGALKLLEHIMGT